MKKSRVTPLSFLAAAIVAASAIGSIAFAGGGDWRGKINTLFVTGDCTVGNILAMPNATTAAAGFILGSDAALYRSAADTLRTPDSFTSDVTVTGADVTATDDVTVGDDLVVTDAITAASLVTTGLIKSSGTAGIGYATGAGGTQTQATDKATTVVLSKTCGAITMNNAQLNAGTIVSFTVTNTTVAATDCIVIQHQSGGTLGSYTVTAAAGAGSFVVYVRNNTAGNLSEALVLQFAVIKAVAA